MLAPPKRKVEFPEKAIPLFKPAPYKVMYGGRSGTKCLAVGTKVIMADGSLRAVEDVRIGEQVMGPDSKPRNVLALDRGHSEMYRIRQTSAMDYVVNAAHILSLKKSHSSKKDRGEKSKAGNWRRPNGRYSGWPDITNINVERAAQQGQRWRSNFRGWRAGCIELPARKIKIDPYFLGLWLGDGTSREMRITSADQEIIDWCQKYALTFGLTLTINKTQSKAFDLGFKGKIGRGYRNELWELFKGYNLANNKHIPREFMLNSKKVRLKLLAGLLDTDGCAAKSGYAIVQVSERLAKDIKQLADGLGFRTSLIKRETICTNNGVRGTAWSISIGGPVWRIPCQIKRKRWSKKEIKSKADHLLSGIKIEPVGFGEYVGFEVDGDHLFLLEDGTVTHNSWDFCRALLILGSQRPLFILCAREIQKSIAESVHRLLEQQADEIGLGHFYDVKENKIVGLPQLVHGMQRQTEIVFAGIRNNITAIKSMEGIDICAVFEATFVSTHSWDILLPTIRGRHEDDPRGPGGPFNKGPEVWIEFNPELASDETYKRWVLEPPEGTVRIPIGWRDNKWFSETSRKQKDDMFKRDYENYLTVWEGQPRRVLQGAIYAKELEAAHREGRISPNIQVDRSKPVDVSCDLGRSDTCSLTFWQQVGTEHRAIDYYGNFGFDWGHYLDVIANGIGEEVAERKKRRYQIGKIYLPHDASNKLLAATKSIERQTRDAYPEEGRVIVVERTSSVVNDINAVRMMFSRMYFNELLCSDLLTGLAHYRFEVDPETKEVSKNPLHDFASHPADSIRCYIMGLKPPRRSGRPQMHQPNAPQYRGDRLGWLNS